MPYVDLAYGKVNLSTTLATYASLKIEPPFTRVTAINSGRQMPGSMQSIPVGRYEMNGVLINCKVDHPTGTVIAVTASWKRKGVPIREGALIVRLREGAPLYDIRARVPTGSDNICGDSFLIFSGYADIVTPAELKLHGIEPNRSYIDRFMDPTELDECFIIKELRPESIPRPTVQAIATAEGVQMREIPNAPGRRLNLRRR